MLGFFAAMQAADEDPGSFPGSVSGETGVTGALETAGVADSGHFRPDNSNPNNAQTAASKGLNGETLVNNAGEWDGRFIVVPNVL
jgi:aspartyl-tRNA(Asn)/glutamyl-tRNA(Gln) amidotransferase subunit C